MRIKLLASLIVLGFTITAFMKTSQEHKLEGAWQLKKSDGTELLLFRDGYFTQSFYSVPDRKFIYSRGGTYTTQDNRLQVNLEFHTASKDDIGKSFNYDLEFGKNNFTSDIGGEEAAWQNVDNGQGELAGNWRITGRMQDGEIREMRGGPRKTLKLLTGTRFQWFAINPSTKEFFGTGGGTYTFKDGKYTERIEFFSRDSSRVGAVLHFDGSVEDDKWHHKGLNSRGEPLHEVWSRDKSVVSMEN